MRLLALISLLLCLTGVVVADYRHHADYERANSFLVKSKYVKAREIGEKMLREDPNSFEAQTILGRVHLHGEGNPGKARYYLEKAHKGLLQVYPQPNSREAPWRCYADILWNLRQAAMDLEDYQGALDWLEEYDSRFPPARPHLAGWPLMKMGRIEDAREKMKQGLARARKSPEAYNSILNTMGAVEYESGDTQASYGYCLQILDRVEHGKGAIDAVFYTNAAESARDLLKLDEAEKHLLKATKYLGRYTYATPWLDLAALYLGQGRQPEAIQALKRQAYHLANCEADIQNQNRAKTQLVLGVTLMACGYDLEAADLLTKVALHGDRNSGTSTSRSLVKARNLFFYREALKQKRERLREQRSYSASTRWLDFVWQDLALGQTIEATRKECAALSINNSGPKAMLRPYGPNGFNCPWLVPALSEVFGRGIVSVEASRLLEDLPEQSKPYTMAVLAEAKGDEESLQQALDALPPSEVLLRGRLHALKREATGSARSLQQAMESDPPVVRRLGISIPVSIQCGDGSLQRMLYGSPRFESGKGFTLQITGGSNNGYDGSFLGPDGSVLSRFTSPPHKDLDEARRKLCEEIHQRVFAPRINLTQSDINGLDGSNLAGSQFRNQLQDLVGRKKKKEKINE